MADDTKKEIIRREVRIDRGSWNTLKAEAYANGKKVLEHAGDILKKHADKSGVVIR